MIRSLRTGVSGLKSNQTRMDVVGNNIANVNTTAFKRSRAAFNEVLGQQLLGVGRTAGGSGINPSHVGLGVSVGSIDQNWGQGSLENTGIQTDLALNGDGFFIASPKKGTSSDQRMLTRAGNFTFNQNGEFVTANGLNVQGWAFDDEGTLNTGQLQNVQFDPNAQSAAKRTETISIGGNLSAELSANASDPDLDADRTSISTVIYDEQGTPKTVTIAFTKSQDMGVDGNTEDAWDFTVKDPETGTDLGTGSLAFDAQGKLSSPSTADFDWDIDGNGADETFTLDFGDSDSGGITQFSGSTTTAVTDQDGNSPGTLAGYSINPEGVLELNFTNGEQKKLFQLAIGNVNNANGLEQQGENFYTTTSASGDLQLGRAGRDVRTAVVAGTLESSNVDLATEFTEMIIAQRGYQASARVITTSDEIMQETVQLKR